MKLSRQFFLFMIGGAIGFVVDAGGAQALVSWGGWNPYYARVLSIPVAATVTWIWNRRQTFASQDSGRSLFSEWAHWMALMGVGALVNYGTYAVLLMLFPLLHKWPAIATAGGSLVAALFNFSTARLVLFKGAKTSV
jgi:putative flippase GtrA